MFTHQSVLSTCREPLSYGYKLNAIIRIRIERDAARTRGCVFGAVTAIIRVQIQFEAINGSIERHTTS
jgi:hypothetical protein